MKAAISKTSAIVTTIVYNRNDSNAEDENGKGDVHNDNNDRKEENERNYGNTQAFPIFIGGLERWPTELIEHVGSWRI